MQKLAAQSTIDISRMRRFSDEEESLKSSKLSKMGSGMRLHESTLLQTSNDG
jgi:hypothetical protein